MGFVEFFFFHCYCHVMPPSKPFIGFINESTTPSSGKTTFFKPCEEVPPNKIESKMKFQCTHCTKMGHTANRCYVRMIKNFQRKLSYLRTESMTLGNRFMQGRKNMVKRDTNIPPQNGVSLMEKLKSQI